MRPRRLRRLVAASAAALVLAGTGTGFVARADGIINATEAAYVNSYGWSVVCLPINKFPTPAMVATVVSAVMADGFPPDSAVDITNASVAVHCPQNWGLLELTGEIARGEYQA